MPVHWLGVVAALLVSPLVLLGLVLLGLAALELALPVALGAVLLESVDVPPIDCAQAPLAKATLRAAASNLRVMTVSCVVGGTALPALQGRCRQADVRRKKLLPRQEKPIRSHCGTSGMIRDRKCHLTPFSNDACVA
jgi:hypothetical protein